MMKTTELLRFRPLLRLVCLMALLIGLAGCKTSRQTGSDRPETGFLSSKVVLTVPT